MSTKKLSEKQIAMLRYLDAEPNGDASVPYRLGADATAKSLSARGLVHLWIPDRGSAAYGSHSGGGRWATYQGRHMAITPAGRAALIALIPAA